MNPDISYRTRRFEEVIVPHLAAAYNLARWITRSDADAEDVVQEASLRAYKYLDGFKGGNGRPWLLSIVRNASYSWLERHRASSLNLPFDEETTTTAASEDPETVLHQTIDGGILRTAMEKMPVEFREIIILRDMEGFSYKEIAQIASIPIGTVMSRIARGRKQLLNLVSSPLRERRSPDDLC